MILILGLLLWMGGAGSAEYIGGTIDSLSAGTGGQVVTNDAQSFIFSTPKTLIRVPYERINQIEYGQKVDHRYLEAILISPVFMLAKRRAHFLTVGYETDDGQQHALVLRVDKNAIRPILVSLEAKTGRKVVYQDEEARKAGKG